MGGVPELVHEQVVRALELVERGEQEGLALRLIGGIAVHVHSPSGGELLRREYADIDLVCAHADGRRLDALVAEFGYQPDARFNSLHGRYRRLYFDAGGQRQIDVFVSDFEMCHKLPLGERLQVDFPTIPLAELFLTKAQIVELNEKDLLDLLTLVAEHEVGAGDEDTINADRVAELCSSDWGLWKTVLGTIERVASASRGLAFEDVRRAEIADRLEALRRVLEEAPKSRRWKARARIGERVRWFELPEDPRRNVGQSPAPGS